MDPFLPFYPLKNQNFEKMKKIATYFINVHQKSWSSIIWWMVPVVQSEMDSMFCHFVLFFSLLPPQQPWKSKSWKKKTTPAHVIILHTCTKNNNHKMYASWDMACNRLRTIFCSFIPVTTWKNIFLKNWKKHLEIWSFYTCVP